MVDEQTRETGTGQQGTGLGFRDLSMNEVPASATPEQSEAPRRAGGLTLIIIAVLLAVTVIAIGARAISNAAPGQEAQDRLRARLMEVRPWQDGIVLDATYMAGNRLRVGFTPRLGSSDADRDTLRKATFEVMQVLMAERPGKDLYIDGFQGDRQTVTARYRQKSTLIGPGGEQIPDIVVRVEGDPEGGMCEASSRGRPMR
jgi:hypothetical protein